MKAIINEDFMTLFLYPHEIKNNWAEVDKESLTSFEVGDEVEVLKELEIGTFAPKHKSYVVYNPKSYESITLAECFLKFL